MKNKFCRTETIDLSAWDAIIRDMKEDLAAISRREISVEAARAYLNDLLLQARPLAANRPEAYFFGFDRPENMPSDARVDYFYYPTYLAVAIAMEARHQYPDVFGAERLAGAGSLTAAEALRILGACMLGCTLREFRGHGCDDLAGQAEAFELFARAHALGFIRDYPRLCPPFNRLFRLLLNGFRAAVDEGRLSDDWGSDYLPAVREALRRMDEESKE